MKHFLFRDEHTAPRDVSRRWVVDCGWLDNDEVKDVPTTNAMDLRPPRYGWFNQVLVGCFFGDGSLKVERDGERRKQVEVEDILCREEGIHYGVFRKITAVGSVFTLKNVWPIFVGYFSRKFDTSDFYPDFLKSSRSWFGRLCQRLFISRRYPCWTEYFSNGRAAQSSPRHDSTLWISHALQSLWRFQIFWYPHLCPGAKMKFSFPSPPHRKLTWQWKTQHLNLKMYFLLNMWILQCHVSFQGCSVWVVSLENVLGCEVYRPVCRWFPFGFGWFFQVGRRIPERKLVCWTRVSAWTRFR